MIGLSKRRLELLQFIVAHVKAHGRSPVREEMCVALGVKSRGYINRMVDDLVAAGFILRTQFRHGGIELAQSKYYHVSGCECADCLHANYLRDLKLVEAIQVAPPANLIPRLIGLKPVAAITRIYWRSGFPRSMRPDSSKSQLQHAPAQSGVR